MSTLTFGPNVDESQVSDCSREVLTHLLDAAGCPGAFVSSFTRTPRHFAEILHDNCVNHGTKSQYYIYTSHSTACHVAVVAGAPADTSTCDESCHPLPTCSVIDVFVASHEINKEDTIVAMTAEIVKQGPYECSHHCADPAVLQVFDLTDASTGSHRQAVIEQAHRGHGISKVLIENNVVHVEIPQPAMAA